MAPRAKGNQLKPEFAGFFGRSGSGKSYALWQKYQEWNKAWKRQTLVWSPKEFDARGQPIDDYAGRLRCKYYRDIGAFVKAARTGKNAVFVPTLNREIDEKTFDLFNRLALAVSPCIIIVEELHTVTRANGGTPSWGVNVRMGRASGITILGASQRPASVDKEFFNGLSFAWCGAQNYEDDAKTTAKLVLRKPQEILILPERQGFTRTM